MPVQKVLGTLVLGLVLLCGGRPASAADAVGPEDVGNPNPDKGMSNQKVEAQHAEGGKQSEVPDFKPRLLEIAKAYQGYGRVDDQLRWAPSLCRSSPPSTPALSASDDKDSHGRKLYYLFAADRQAYLESAEGKAQSAGQVLVKESWIPKEVAAKKMEEDVWRRREVVSDGSVRTMPATHPVTEGEVRVVPKGEKVEVTERFTRYVKQNGKVFHASESAGLFIMYKLDAKTEGTDNGWVYGTISPDLKTVTGAGRLQNCMECHVQSKKDRLIGVPRPNGDE
ncbi:MAG: hypothetical protein L6R28_08940 [Planctomycetes bacterium]|nr:hypothetical protein [Planctomycetota bacterium]